MKRKLGFDCGTGDVGELFEALVQRAIEPGCYKQRRLNCRQGRSKMRITTGVLACVAIYLVLGAANLQASIISSGDLLTVNSSNRLQSFTFSGIQVDSLQITGFAATGIAQGVSVINGHLYIGLVSSSFTPKIAEIDPTTGATMQVFNTAAPQITALGDDGTNLLILESVYGFNVYTYTTGGAFVSNVPMTRPFPGIYQGEGIDGAGQTIFMSYASNNQPIITNNANGAAVSYFNTNMNPITNYIGGMAYSANDGTLWVAGNGEFRNYTQSGTLLSTSYTFLGNAHVTGLEVIARAQSVPEPGSIVTMLSLFVCGSAFIRRRP